MTGTTPDRAAKAAPHPRHDRTVDVLDRLDSIQSAIDLRRSSRQTGVGRTGRT